MKYTLTKIQKGNVNLYIVKDENGKLISKRESTRDYVACTVNGRFFFGRVDLIGKGEHGKMLRYANDILKNPEKSYKSMLAWWVNEYRQDWANEHPYDEWVKERTAYATELKRDLGTIVYLK